MSNDAPIHECESEIDHYTGHYVPYSLRRVCGFFNVPQIYYMCKGLWDGAYGLSSLSEKTRKSNLLQTLLQRQHFLLSYFKTLNVGLAGVWTYGLTLSRLALIPLSLSLCITTIQWDTITPVPQKLAFLTLKMTQNNANQSYNYAIGYFSTSQWQASIFDPSHQYL